MGVVLRVAELGVDAGFEALGDEVLQALGFVVQLVDFVVEHAVEEGLDEAVVADDFEGAAASGGERGGRRDGVRTRPADSAAAASFCSMLVMEAGATCRRSASAVEPTRRSSAPPSAKMAFR